eukprot:g1275.t1
MSGFDSDFAEVDGLIQEYLLFRGFTRTFRALDWDRSHDQTHQFNVDSLLAEIQRLITTHDSVGLTSLWRFLHLRFFSCLDAGCTRTIARLEGCLNRYFLITAVRAGETDAALEFLVQLAGGNRDEIVSDGENNLDTNSDSIVKNSNETGDHINDVVGRELNESRDGKIGGDLNMKDESNFGLHQETPRSRKRDVKRESEGEFRGKKFAKFKADIGHRSSNVLNSARAIREDYAEWFSLPFIPEPHRHPRWAAYFDPSWEELFLLSLRNFLQSIFRSLPLPRLLSFKLGRLQQTAVKSQLRSTQAEVRRLRSRLIAAEKELHTRTARSLSLAEEINRTHK